LWNNGSWEKLILLNSFHGSTNIFFLYNSNSEPYFIGYRQDDGYYYGEHGLEGDIGLGGINFSPGWINSIDFLTEAGISYSSEKLGNRIGEAWAYRFNGQNNYGTLILDWKGLPPQIYMSSGFISYSNPNLYRENARPKTLRLSCNNKYEIIELEDTPHFQHISILELPDSFDSIITMEILEIYQGTKYNDVCINSFYVGAWQ
jgi:hypothetical protein